MPKIKERILKYWNHSPLQLILILALLFRLLAVIFSKGYGMHDDHFIVIETPWSWTQNFDYDKWLPKSLGEDPQPSGKNFFYSGINYLYFKGMQGIGVRDPYNQMFLMRLLLALFSVLAVWYTYKIVQLLADEKSARMAALLNAVFWFMPFLSVRTMNEIVAIPILFAGFWLYLKHENNTSSFKQKIVSVFFAGFVTAISISIRYQVGIFLVGMGLVMIFQGKWRNLLFFSLGSILSLFITQGITDIIVWGKPFVEMLGYFQYNIENRHVYGNAGNILMYFELIPGILLPPVSLFLFFGFFRTWKKYAILFVPNLLFLLFHTYFPNRQERFILTIVPMIVLLGVMGWNEFIVQSKYWQKRERLHSRCWKFFWILNILLLIPVSLSSSKKSRIDVMHYFYQFGNEVNTVLVDDTSRDKYVWLPVYYAGRPIQLVGISLADGDVMGTKDYVRFTNSLDIFDEDPALSHPEYVVFVENTNLEERVEKVREKYPDLQEEAHIRPSLIDRIMKKLNPINANEDFYIYKVN